LAGTKLTEFGCFCFVFCYPPRMAILPNAKLNSRQIHLLKPFNYQRERVF